MLLVPLALLLLLAPPLPLQSLLLLIKRNMRQQVDLLLALSIEALALQTLLLQSLRSATLSLWEGEDSTKWEEKQKSSWIK